MDGTQRKHIKPGIEVDIVLKQDQSTGELTRGIVKDILTRKSFHPRGIKVRLADGQVGRVQHVIQKHAPPPEWHEEHDEYIVGY